MLEEAFELSRFGERKDWGTTYMERVARHEAGHAVISALGGRIPSYLTIVARGDHGGYMENILMRMNMRVKPASPFHKIQGANSSAAC